MKCPDCGTRLSETRVTAGPLWRCFKCGGVWVDSWTANRIKADELRLWRRISVPEEWLKGGNGMCPLDGLMLQRYIGDSVPRSLVAKRCVRCGRWWFPSDTFFDYKPAAEAKVNYFRHWGVAADVGNMILPIVSVAILLTGVGITVGLVRVRQQAAINASIGLKDYAGVYVGGGRAMVTFTSDVPVEAIEYRVISNSGKWFTIKVTAEGHLYNVTLVGLTEGERYIVKIREREYLLNTN